MSDSEQELRILVCGGRDFTDDRLVRQVMLVPLTAAQNHNLRLVIIEGGARGADRLARVWAKARGLEVRTYLADWSKHGRAAGPLRNQQMLRESKPHGVIAFPGHAGTAHMVRITKEAGVPLWEVSS